MKSSHLGSRKSPCIIEFAGVSGVGKSFLYQKLKEKLAGDPQYLFVEKSLYNRLQVVYPGLFVSTVIKMLRCNIRPWKRFSKYIKLWYFTQVLMDKGLKSNARFVFIDEGPLHRVRAIRSHSTKKSDFVKKLFLNNKTLITDIVIFIDSDSENIYSWRQKRGTRAVNSPFETLENNKDKSFSRTVEDILYIKDNIKDITMTKVINSDSNIQAVLDQFLISIH